MQSAIEEKGEITFTQQYTPKVQLSDRDPVFSLSQKDVRKLDQTKEAESSSSNTQELPKVKALDSPVPSRSANKGAIVGHRKYILELYGSAGAGELEKCHPLRGSNRKVFDDERD